MIPNESKMEIRWRKEFLDMNEQKWCAKNTEWKLWHVPSNTMCELRSARTTMRTAWPKSWFSYDKPNINDDHSLVAIWPCINATILSKVSLTCSEKEPPLCDTVYGCAAKCSKLPVTKRILCSNTVVTMPGNRPEMEINPRSNSGGKDKRVSCLIISIKVDWWLKCFQK